MTNETTSRTRDGEALQVDDDTPLGAEGCAADADADTDTNSDTDTDVDTNSDSDAGTDTDDDSDSDADTDAETDSERSAVGEVSDRAGGIRSLLARVC